MSSSTGTAGVLLNGTATVKSVQSGDTLVLIGKPAANGPPPEIILTLEHLQSPKIARPGGKITMDENYGFDSREFLRKLTVGKPVTFQVTQNVPAINRIFGNVFLEGGVSLSKLIVEAGWASLKDARDLSSEQERFVYEELQALNAIAKSEHRGIYSDNINVKRNSVRNINFSLDAVSYFRDLQDKAAKGTSPKIHVIVEQVRDGASFRCYIPENQSYVTILLAGVICPRVNLNAAPAAEGEAPPSPEPFALQSKLFSEMRVLNRELDVEIYGTTSPGPGISASKSEAALYGTFFHPKGNITVELLRSGLSKVADWTIALLTRELVGQMRQAEIEAKVNKLGVWSEYVEPAPSPDARTFEGRVIEVLSGDTIVVAELAPSNPSSFPAPQNFNISSLSHLEYAETKVSLASIRAPRLGGPAGKSSSVSEPLAAESKEFVRNRLLGKQVSVKVEYSRAAGAAYSEQSKRLYATVLFGKSFDQNIAEHLVLSGLAVSTKHKADDPKSSFYDNIILGEAEAAKAKRGIHGFTGQPDKNVNRVNDVAGDTKKAKQMFTFLSKSKSYKAIIEHVFTGNRIKVLIPTENVSLVFALSQVRCPILPKPPALSDSDESLIDTVAADPYGPLALIAKRFTEFNLLQRQVEIEITDQDKNGVFLGKLFIPRNPNATSSIQQTPIANGQFGYSFAAILVENGLAYIDKFSESRGGKEIESLLELQTATKQSKHGIWHVSQDTPYANTVVEESVAQQVLDAPPGLGGPEILSTMDRLLQSRIVNVKLSEIYTGTSFAVHLLDEDGMNFDLEKLEKRLLEHDPSSVVEEEHKGDEANKANYRKGAFVLARDHSSQNGRWCRAKVEQVSGSGKDRKANVYYLDYGHKDTISAEDVATLPADLHPQTLPPLAVVCHLAFLRAHPVSHEHGLAAARALNSLAWEKECSIKILARDSHDHHGHGHRKGQKDNKDTSSSSATSTVTLHVILYPKPLQSILSGEPLEDGEILEGGDVDASSQSVNETLVRNGFIRISSKSQKRLLHLTLVATSVKPYLQADMKSLVESIEAAQDEARSGHVRIWRYGDPGDSDEEGNSPTR